MGDSLSLQVQPFADFFIARRKWRGPPREASLVWEGSSVGKSPSPGVQDLNAGECVLQEVLDALSLMHHNKF